MDTLRGLNIPPGHYAMPKPASMKEHSSPEFKAKIAKGPVMLMHVRRPDISMGKSLVQWFAYCIVVSVFTAYVVGHTISPDAESDRAPRGRLCCFHGLWTGAVPGSDLGFQRMGRDLEGCFRCADLRTGYRRDVWVVVAVIFSIR